MLNRRLIRIKVFQILFSEFGQGKASRTTLSSLKRSLEGIETQLYSLLVLPLHLADYAQMNFDPAEKTFKPSEAQIKSFDIFTKNNFVTALKSNPEVASFFGSPRDFWTNEVDFMASLYQQVRKSDFHQIEVSQVGEVDLHRYLLDLFDFLLNDNEDFDQFMEDQVIFWNDERIPLAKAITHLIQQFIDTNKVLIPETSKDPKEDIAFAEQLYTNASNYAEDLTDLIIRYTPGWDKDRITLTDHVLMRMAISEFIHLPYIPVKVTINEYLEIAKSYSTPKSSVFLNGTLDKIKNELLRENKIVKKGRGLVG